MKKAKFQVAITLHLHLLIVSKAVMKGFWRYWWWCDWASRFDLYKYECVRVSRVVLRMCRGRRERRIMNIREKSWQRNGEIWTEHNFHLVFPARVKCYLCYYFICIFICFCNDNLLFIFGLKLMEIFFFFLVILMEIFLFAKIRLFIIYNL